MPSFLEDCAHLSTTTTTVNITTSIVSAPIHLRRCTPSFGEERARSCCFDARPGLFAISPLPALVVLPRRVSVRVHDGLDVPQQNT